LGRSLLKGKKMEALYPQTIEKVITEQINIWEEARDNIWLLFQKLNRKYEKLINKYKNLDLLKEYLNVLEFQTKYSKGKERNFILKLEREKERLKGISYNSFPDSLITKKYSFFKIEAKNASQSFDLLKNEILSIKLDSEEENYEVNKLENFLEDCEKYFLDENKNPFLQEKLPENIAIFINKKKNKFFIRVLEIKNNGKLRVNKGLYDFFDDD